jgi:6-phosphogluconate dehydrogenase
MEIGLVGLGRMGGGILRRLNESGHKVVAFDTDESVRAHSQHRTLMVVDSIEHVVENLSRPVPIILALPSGKATEDSIKTLSTILSAEDIVIDTSNSNYKDSVRRGAELNSQGIHLLDVGISGGILGDRIGYSLTIGGTESIVHKLSPIFQTLTPEGSDGFAHVGPQGAGHFAKMVHNGIEYGLMQAYAEGFDILHSSNTFEFDLEKIAASWNAGGVIRSWLLQLIETSLQQNPSMKHILPYVEDSGEGRWAVEEAINSGVPIPVISLALQARFRSRETGSFAFKLVASMREQFGGHRIHSS